MHTPLCMRRGLMAVAVACALALPYGSHAASLCSQYTADSAVPEGYASPANIFSSLKELILDATCTSESILVTLGSRTGEKLVYKSGYFWNGSAWETYTASGEELVNNMWYKQLASASIPHQGEYTYFTGYVCVRKGNEWKCGCKDDACTERVWQVQLVKKP